MKANMVICHFISAIAIVASASAEQTGKARLFFRSEKGRGASFLAQVDLAKGTYSLTECLPSVPENCNFSFSQWGDGVCIYPAGGMDEANIGKIMAIWAQKYNIDVDTFPSKFSINTSSGSISGDVEYVVRSPKESLYAVVLKGKGLFILDAERRVKKAFAESGVQEPSWDSSGRFLVFARQMEIPEDEPPSYCGNVYDSTTGQFSAEIPTTYSIMNPASAKAPVWNWLLPVFSFVDVPLPSLLWTKQQWQKAGVIYQAVPNSNLRLTLVGNINTYLGGCYLATMDGTLLVYARSLFPASHTAIWLTPVMNLSVVWQDGADWKLCDYTKGVAHDIPDGDYWLLDVDSPPFDGQGPEEALEWIQSFNPKLGNDWSGWCVVYPPDKTPPLPKYEICSRNRTKLFRALGKNFAEFAKDKDRHTAAQQWDRHKALGEYLATHPEIKCPIGGTYRTTGSYLYPHVTCSKHRPDQFHD